MIAAPSPAVAMARYDQHTELSRLASSLVKDDAQSRVSSQCKSTGQLVMNEIHCPNMVGMGRLRAVSPQLRLDPALGNLVAELEVHLLVKTIDSLRVHGSTFALDKDMHTPVAVA